YELLAKAIHQDQLDVPLSAEDKERLLEHLIHQGYLNPSDLRYTGTAARGYISRPLRGPDEGQVADPYDFSALLQSGLWNSFRSILSYDMQATMFQPVGGMDQIPRAFQRAIGDKITFHAEVQQVRQTPDGVRVIYRDKKLGRLDEVSADYCIIALPTSIMNQLDADFSPEVRTALRNVSYTPAGKIGLQMRRRFWEEDDQIYGGHSYTDLPIGNISYPNNDYHSQKGIVL